MSKIIKILSLLVSVSFLILYTVASLAICRGSHTEWTTGNIHAYGLVGFAGYGIKFFGVDIGDKDNEINKNNKFSIELKNGHRISSDDMTLDVIEKLNPIIIDSKNYDGSSTRYYRVDDGEFSFKENKLILFRIGTENKKSSVMKIGNYAMTYFFQFPITQEQYYLLFGKPDKTKNYYSL